jgi:hypothetical protein
MAESLDTTPRPLIGWPGYLVTVDGRVISLKGKTPRQLKPYIRPQDGYACVVLSRRMPARTRTFYAHQLVLRAFVGEPGPGQEGCHADGDPGNNHLDNLRWDNRASNISDAQRHGTFIRGERCAIAKLTDAGVALMRAKYRKGEYGYKRLAQEFGVSEVTAFSAINRLTWRHVP